MKSDTKTMKHINIKILALSLSIFFTQNVFSQVELVKRLEFDHDELDGFVIYPIENSDKALGVSTPEDADDYQKEFTLYDANLNPIRKGGIKSDFHFTKSLIYNGEKYRYTILHYHRSGEFQLFKTNLEDLTSESYSGSIPKLMRIDDFGVNGDIIYFDLRKKRTAAIGVYPLGAQKTQIYSPDALAGTKGYIYKLQKVEGADEEVMFFFETRSKRNHEVHIFRFDKNGKQLPKWSFKNLEKKIVSFSAYKVAPDKYLAIGEYSQKSISSSEGMFSAIISSNGNISFKEHQNFIEMPNFLEYLSEKRERKIEKKAERKKSRGKELTYQFNSAKHKIMRDGDDYLYACEFYYATYRTEWYTTYVNGNPVRQSRRVFDGYQYTHSLISVYDKDGNYKWSNIFRMWLRNKPFYVKHFLTLSFKDGAVDALYTTGNAIFSKSFKDGKVTQEKTYDLLTTGEENDKIKYSVGTDISHWYGNYFLNDGFQKIKNKENESGKRKRKVYYVNLYKI